MNNNNDLIAAVARLSRMMRRRPVEDDALTHMGYHILQAVQQNDGIRTTELAELVGVRPASISEALGRLEHDGYVTREKDAADSRAKRVFITDKTREQFEQRAKSKQEENDRLLACLTEDEATMFLTVCDKLCAFLEQEDPSAVHKREDHHRHHRSHGQNCDHHSGHRDNSHGANSHRHHVKEEENG